MAKNGTETLTVILVLAVFVLLVAVPFADAAVEVCNYHDEDGDGLCLGGSNEGNNCTTPDDCPEGYCIMADEDFILQGIPTAVWGCYGENGTCSDYQGDVECLDEQTSICSTDPGGFNDKSSPEVCDYIDNDCDGIHDEGFEVQGIPTAVWGCYGENGTCSDYQGDVECLDEQTSICSTDPGGFNDKSSPEICNGLDDDCDSVNDNGGNSLCSNWSISQVATCGYTPDANPFTWDWFPAFDSVCQGTSGCTIYDGSYPWTLDIDHICDTQCSAECEDHDDCATEEYCYTDGCSCEIVGDVNLNGVVNGHDFALVGAAYGSTQGDGNWNENADIDPKGGDGAVDMDDIDKIGLIITEAR